MCATADPTGRQRARTFTRRRDAEAYEDELNQQLRRGDWIDPRRGQVLLSSVWDEYERVGTGHLRATTRQNYRAAWRNIAPHFGTWPVNRIEHADVAEWVRELSETKGPETVRAAHRVLCLVLDYAIQARRLTLNPARGVRLPRRPPARERILTVEEVQALADRLGRDGDLVLAMAYLGLRWSELAALKVSDVDLVRRRVRVVERATEVGGKMDVSAPKSRASKRHVAIPALLEPSLRSRLSGKPHDALVYSAPDGGYLRNGNWRSRSGWAAATRELGLDGVTPARPAPHIRVPGPGRRGRPSVDPARDGPRVHHHDGEDLRPPLRRRAGHRRRCPRPAQPGCDGDVVGEA